jgi:hypothetical protein
MEFPPANGMLGPLILGFEVIASSWVGLFRAMTAPKQSLRADLNGKKEPSHAVMTDMTGAANFLPIVLWVQGAHPKKSKLAKIRGARRTPS